jgi:glycosyltransferase involved in cell wall biosynthesis
MNVAYLASALGGPGGIPRFTRELMVALAARDDVVLTPIVPEDALDVLGSLSLRHARPPLVIGGGGQVAGSLWERYRLGPILERAHVDVVHGVKHLVPRTSIPTVLTVHDVMAITWPSQFRYPKRALLPRQYLASMRAATVLVAVSEATRARIGRVDPALLDKTVVVGEGVGSDLLTATPAPVAALADRDFALVVGDLSPRKNLGVLLDVWPEVHRATGLVLAAVAWEAWHSEQTRARLQGLAADGSAVWVRGAADPELRWCYEHARVVLVPSLEEGYGLPVVEALAFGARVVASDDPALVEVGRGRPLHVPARDARAWEEAVKIAARMPIESGSAAPVAPVSWADAAAGTVEAYQRARRAAAGGGVGARR